MNPKNFYEFLKPGSLDYLKVYLVLFYKTFSWEKELEFEFSISTKIVKKAIEIMESEGIIISRDFWNIEIDEQETINKMNAGYFNKIKNSPKLYTLTQEGNELHDYTYKEEILDLIQKNQSLKISLNFILQKAQAYKILKRENHFKDQEKEFRQRLDPQTGTIYLTRTSEHKSIQKQIKQAVQEIKKQKLKNKQLDQNKITNKNSSSLKNKEHELQKFERKSIIKYNDKNISACDYDNILSNLEAQDRIIENSKTEKGKLDFDIKKKTKHLKNMSLKQIIKHEPEERDRIQKVFGFSDKDIDLAEFEKNENLFNNIINEIEIKKRLSTFTVEDRCNDKNTFNNFIKYIEDTKITVDEEFDFFYKLL